MPYLTFEEYKDLGFKSMDETEFRELIRKASDIIDDVTGFFYKHNDFINDHEFRRNQFKKAVAAQIEYFNELGGTTTESINKTPQAFSAGRTSVSMGGRNQTTGHEQKTLISKDAIGYLRWTGLLYTGVAIRC